MNQMQLLDELPFDVPDKSLLFGIYEEVCEAYQVQPKQEAVDSIIRGIAELHLLEKQLDMRRNENDSCDTYER